MAGREQGRDAPLTPDHKLENEVTEITSIGRQTAYFSITGAELTKV
jgi:hypothetical protein